MHLIAQVFFIDSILDFVVSTISARDAASKNSRQRIILHGAFLASSLMDGRRIHRSFRRSASFKNPSLDGRWKKVPTTNTVLAMWKNETQDQKSEPKTVVMVVAYPGDETLFAGGQVLLTPDWRWHIVAVFTGSKPDISKRFIDTTTRLRATGEILDVSEKREKQTPLRLELTARVMRILAAHKPDILVTHNPVGECRKLLGRDILGRIITELWSKSTTTVQKLWIFAYEDDNTEAVPMAADDSDRSICLPNEVWQAKRDILLNSYGFGSESFFVRSCPLEEAFFCFNAPDSFRTWRKSRVSPSRTSTMDPRYFIRGKSSQTR